MNSKEKAFRLLQEASNSGSFFVIPAFLTKKLGVDATEAKDILFSLAEHGVKMRAHFECAFCKEDTGLKKTTEDEARKEWKKAKCWHCSAPVESSDDIGFRMTFDISTLKSAGMEETPEIEVRRTPDGEIDEILLYRDGECLVHLEYMDKDKVWIGLYGKKTMAHINITGKRKLNTRVDVDSL